MLGLDYIFKSEIHCNLEHFMLLSQLVIRLQKLVMPATESRTCGPYFFQSRSISMNKRISKPFLTYSDQINNLIYTKKLSIHDTSYAISKLQDICYYSLIDGYKELFYNPMTRTYEANFNTEHSYVVYQRNTYGNVPLWVIIKTLTLGQTSKMYSFLNTSLQSKISKHYKSVSEKELSQHLKLLTHFRNICAHNEHLFSFQSRYEIPDTDLHKKMQIPKSGNQYLYGKHDLFAVVISFRYLLNKEDFIIFKRKLNHLIKSFTKKTTPNKKNKLLHAMGFPENWMNIGKYKI